MTKTSQNPERAQNTHKVAFTGAGGVGKTALLKSIKKQFGGPSVGFIDEAARVYFKINPGIPEAERYSFEHQELIQSMVIGIERAAHFQELGYLFADRSVFDAAICVASTGDRKSAKKLLRRVKMWVPGSSDIAYSQIYVLDPVDVPFENDSERIEDEATHRLQHEMFLDFFRDHDINHKLLSGTLDERTEQVLAELPGLPQSSRRTD